jgi:hypothetical protein
MAVAPRAAARDFRGVTAGASAARSLRTAARMSSALRLGAGAALLAGCHWAGMLVAVMSGQSRYNPGALLARADSPLRARRVGCLDIAVAVEGAAEVPVESPVLALACGNGCDRSLALDLTQLRVWARYPGGERQDLTAYDPRQEIHSVPLDGQTQATERISFRPSSWRGAPADAVCVDVSAVNRDAPPGAAPPVCFQRRDGAMVPTGASL